MMVINNNIPALTTYGIVNNTSNQLQKSIQKLSTGLRINSAADDAAGLSISEKMRAQINGLDRAVANAQDGVSLIQTAEGALTETHSILQRMRELSVQAANDTLTAQDRSYIQEEVDLLRDEIDHIGNTTTFNTKKLLNGDAAVLWSSDKLSTKAIVNGGLREIDQFGQKKSFEGNYKIAITANPGQAEIQKTDIFKVKHTGAGAYGDIASASSELVDTMDGSNLVEDVEYNVSSLGAGAAIALSNPTAPVAYKVAKDNVFSSGVSWLSAAPAAAATGNDETNSYSYDLAFEVTDVTVGDLTDTNATSSVTLAITGFQTAADGSVTKVNATQTLTTAPGGSTAQIASAVDVPGLTFTAATMQFAQAGFTRATISNMTKGDKVLINVSNGTPVNTTSKLQIKYDDVNGKSQTHQLNVGESVLKKDGSATVNFMYLDTKTGDLKEQSITINLTNDFDSATTGKNFKTAKDIGVVQAYKIGDVARSNVKLRDLDKFWDSQGNFMLEDPQTITINQGNGKKAQITLYGYDTLKDVENKLNSAIADQLGQKAYVDSSATNHPEAQFVNYVNNPKETTSESVLGTFVIRSLVPGTDGTLRFASKNEDLINALSLNTIQEAKASTYNVSITDAHTGETVVEDTTITGNKLMGALHPNIDVEFDATGGLQATWDNATKKFTYADSETQYTILHLADNTMTFQIGANEGDDMGIHIGDMRAHALGLDSVLVTDRDSASRSITIIDSAIDKVSTQRAKLGAYQNRLEHTMTNLSTSAENLTASESRIRDTDMAKEMMNFTKLQIMLQAGNSMLAQANQLPQNVLSLIR